MKSWIYAVMVVTAAALAGCSSGTSGGTGGEGGSGDGGTGGEGGTPMMTTTTTGMMTTTSTGMTTMPPVDCTAEATFSDCANCFAEEYPDGAMLYNEVVVCAFCTGCYTTCDGASLGCPSAPPMKDACDTEDMPDEMACDNAQMTGCVSCALGSTCQTQLVTCQQSPDCIDFANAIQTCPQN